MNISKLLFVTIAASALIAGEASAKGCLSGAAVGGAAGHFAGHHAIVGAGVGCLVGRHRANRKDRTAAAQQNATAASATAPVPAGSK